MCAQLRSQADLARQLSSEPEIARGRVPVSPRFPPFSLVRVRNDIVPVVLEEQGWNLGQTYLYGGLVAMGAFAPLLFAELRSARPDSGWVLVFSLGTLLGCGALLVALIRANIRRLVRVDANSLILETVAGPFRSVLRTPKAHASLAIVDVVLSGVAGGSSRPFVGEGLFLLIAEDLVCLSIQRKLSSAEVNSAELYFGLKARRFKTTVIAPITAML